jgi:hypothetical protein
MPSDHAGAIRKGCVQRPIERISRRSWVHRPIIGELASPQTDPMSLPVVLFAESPGVVARALGPGMGYDVSIRGICIASAAPFGAVVREWWADCYFESSLFWPFSTPAQEAPGQPLKIRLS